MQRDSSGRAGRNIDPHVLAVITGGRTCHEPVLFSRSKRGVSSESMASASCIGREDEQRLAIADRRLAIADEALAIEICGERRMKSIL